jgi:phosphatidate phosphatase APP1
MSGWQSRLAGILNEADEGLDKIKAALGDRLGRERAYVIVPYTGYGWGRRARVYGRVLANPGDMSAAVDDSLWDNLTDMYRRIESDELPFPQLDIALGEARTAVLGDAEGFFYADLQLASPGLAGGVQTVRFTLRQPGEGSLPPVEALGQVVFPGKDARFGVISDLDDTVLQSYATEPLRMLRTMLTGNAQTRRPFAGVAAFYRGLHAGTNPIFYLSSSPWNLYDLFTDFMELQEIPFGPLMLRDWGITSEEFLPMQHTAYKLGRLKELLDFYEPLKFVLIGDDGQQDPQIYRQVVADFPGRITAVLIRLVHPAPDRLQEVTAIGAGIRTLGTAFAMGADTMALAAEAARLGLIDKNICAAVVAAQEATDES